MTTRIIKNLVTCTLILLVKNHLTFHIAYITNKNTLTGPANCNNTNRHHAHLSLFAKSRKSSGAKSRKWPKTSISAIFWRLRGQISQNCSFFVKNRFYLNWRSYLVLTSGQNPKESLEPFLREISKCLILG